MQKSCSTVARTAQRPTETTNCTYPGSFDGRANEEFKIAKTLVCFARVSACAEALPATMIYQSHMDMALRTYGFADIKKKMKLFPSPFPSR